MRMQTKVDVFRSINLPMILITLQSFNSIFWLDL